MIRLVRRAAGAAVSKLGRRSDEALYAGYAAQSLRARAFINIGAGKFEHRYWTNVDYASDWYARAQRSAFVNYDLVALQPLPFAAGSIELAYTSHTIEHVPFAAVENLFREVHRVLKPGGAFRVTCPDARLLWLATRESRLGYWRWRARWFSGPLSTAPTLEAVTALDYLVREIATPRCRFYAHARDPRSIDEVAAAFEAMARDDFLDWLTADLTFDARYPGDHINWWDESKIETLLRDAGFSRVERSRRGQSLFPPLTEPSLFDTTQAVNSLYVEAVR